MVLALGHGQSGSGAFAGVASGAGSQLPGKRFVRAALYVTRHQGVPPFRHVPRWPRSKSDSGHAFANRHFWN